MKYRSFIIIGLFVLVCSVIIVTGEILESEVTNPSLLSSSLSSSSYLINQAEDISINYYEEKGVLYFETAQGDICNVSMLGAEGSFRDYPNGVEFDFKGTGLIPKLVYACNNEKAMSYFDFSTVEKEYSKVNELNVTIIKPQSYDYDLIYIPTKVGEAEECIKINKKTQECLRYNLVDISENLLGEITFVQKEDIKLSLTDVWVIDPVFTIVNLSLDVSSNNVTCEGGGKFCHLTTNLTSGLILYMPFDVENSSTTVYDWSGEDNDGIGLNVVYDSMGGLNNSGCYNITRNLNDISIPSPSYPDDYNNDSFTTWATWIRFEATAEADRFFISADASLYTESTTRFRYDRQYTGTNGAWRITKSPDYGGGWHHIAVVHNATVGGSLYFYYDGVNVPAIVNTSVPTGGPAPLVAGGESLYLGSQSTHVRDCNCSMDEVMLFNRMLSATEILQIYNQQFPKFETNVGNHTINQTIDSGENRVNVTIQHSNQEGNGGTNLSLSIYDGTSWTAYQNMSDDVNATFTIDTGATILNLSFLYYSDTNKFWSPILEENILLHTFTGGAPPADTCTYTSGNWAVDCSDNCIITENVNLGGNDISIIGTGTFTMNGFNITNFANRHIRGTDSSNICTVRCLNGGCFNK